MSRLRVVLLLLFGVAIVVVIFFIQYLSTLHRVSFIVTSPVAGKLYKTTDGKKEILPQVINSSIDVSFQNGYYCVEPTNVKYNLEPVCFNVEGKDISVAIDPVFSKEYLNELLTEDELLKIDVLIRKTYVAVISDFVLKKGELFGHGEWYGATLTQKVRKGEQGDVYRVLLNKKNDIWVVAAYPQLTLNKFDYPQIPYGVLDGINRLSGVQGST